MLYQQVNECSIFYEVIGIGDPVLFLHSTYSRCIIAFGGYRPHMPMEQCKEVNIAVHKNNMNA